MRPTRLLTIALASSALLIPATAQASPTQTSIMMDDDLLVYRDDSTAARTLTQMRSLGVDTARVTVLWKIVAENARPSKAEIAKLKGSAKENARKQAKRFRAADPSTYPRRNWDRFDNLVKSAANIGVKIYFNVTGPGPAWAHEQAPASQRALAGTWKPRPTAFKQFVTAVGKRYGGAYRDENASRGILPAVRFWSLWNEPNQAGWLSPQWEQRGGATVPASPALYRKLHQYGYKGLVASGHRTDNDIILMGETAPLGSDARTGRAPMRPAQFLRELACIQPDGTPYTGAAASARSCGDFAARGGLPANGYAHHPYTKNVGPTIRDLSPDSLTMANISDLGTLLDSLSSKTGGAIKAGLPLFMTEFGFETSPPDPFSGVPLAAQAKFNMIGEFLAWNNPRIASQAQFLLRDVSPVRARRKGTKPYWFTYQSGLYFLNGTAKPAASAYALPFLAFDSKTLDPTGAPIFNVWGQLRFRPNIPTNATVQWRARDGSTPWISVGDPIVSDTMGYFSATRTAPMPVLGEWRGAFILPDGSVRASSPGTIGD